MDNNAHIPDELSNTCPLLAGMSRRNVFAVPPGYFNGLADTIITRIKRTGLPANAISRELETVAPLLNTISRRNIFTIAPGYFDQAVGVLPVVNAKKEKAKLFSLHGGEKWVRYAAAAVMTGVLVTGVFLYSNKEEKTPEYEKYTRIDVSSALDKVSDTELVNYLKNNERFAVSGEQAVAVNQELPEAHKHISMYSDAELKQYLNENADLEIVKGDSGSE